MTFTQRLKEKFRKMGKSIVALFAKSAKLVKCAKFFKLMKFSKFFITGGSMALSILVYSARGGWMFATGFVILLFCHEMGHVIALRQKGFKVNAPVFIPMVGALIFVPDVGDRDTEAYIGIGGPVLGTLSALLPLAAWWLIPSHPPILLSLSWIALFLNLFNLIPISPMDGGRITQAVGSWFKYVGGILLLLFSIMLREPSILLIWIIVLSDFHFNYKLRFAMTLTCQVAMFVMMMAGIGHSSWVEVLTDMILASLFNLHMFFCALRKETPVDPDQRPRLPMRQGIHWLWRYCLLAAVIIAMMMMEYPWLHPVK